MERDRERADRVTVARHDELAVGQLGALGQRRVDVVGDVDTLEPVVQQRLQPGVAEAQQVAEPGQGLVRVGDRRLRQRVERELGRRRVGGEGAHGLEPADLERAHALAQRRLERGLPARFDVDLRPQPRQGVEAVLRQPGLELAFGLDLLLQRAQRVEARAQIRLLRAFGVDAVLPDAALVVQRRHLLAQLVEPRVGDREGRVGNGVLLLQFGQPLRIGRGELMALGGEPVAARVELAVLVVEVAALGREHLNLLLHRGDLAALLVAGVLRRAQCVFQGRQVARLLLGLRGQQLALLAGRGDLPGDLFELEPGVGLARQPLLVLHRQFEQPLLDARPALDHIADALLQPAHLERRLGQRTLVQVQFVARGVVPGADRLERGLAVAQLGGARLERVDGLGDGLPDARLLARRVAVLQEPELVQLELARCLQRAVPARDLGLLLELVQVAVEFAQDVFDAGEVLARVLQARLGLAAALLVLRDAGGLFEEQPQLLGLALDDARDRALADDRVGARPEARAEEHVLHVAAAHRLVVDEVAAAAVARQHALHGDFGEAAPRPAGTAVLVAERQLDARAARRLAQPRAVEDHVLHRLAAQLAGLALAQHPAHRVHDVGLAAAVRPDDPDQLPRQLEVGGLGEGLETGELDRVQAHGAGDRLAPKCLIYLDKTHSLRASEKAG